MPIAPCRIPALIVILSLLFVQLPSDMFAQSAPISAQQLDQLLAPIALYPDSLLAQITTASTNPQEILDVANWLASNPGLTGDQIDQAAQQQGFDPAFLALVHFPTVLQMMSENIDDYAAIGQEVTKVIRPRFQPQFSGYARRPTLRARCAPPRSKRLLCNRGPSQFMLSSRQIRKLCTCLNTIQQLFMPPRAQGRS